MLITKKVIITYMAYCSDTAEPKVILIFFLQLQMLHCSTEFQRIKLRNECAKV